MINRKILICIILGICSLKISAQNNSLNNSCIFLDIDYTGAVNIYDKPGGKTIQSLKHDMEDENFLMFTILQKNDSMFLVNAYYSIPQFDSTSVTGWIKKNNKLEIYSRAYNEPLILYTYPDKNKGVKTILKEYYPDMWIVTDCHKNWLKVKAMIEGKLYEGWISPEMQCCNVYTTCS